jgi:drug/metabolite transporter (DMT)-like permease
MNLIGGIAGLATSFFFAISAIVFTKAGRRVGSQVTNRTRLAFAFFYLLVLNLALFREPLPLSAAGSRWVWLGLSGIIGLSLGDAFLFRSFVALGARLGVLLLSLAPVFGSVIAWVFLGETLTRSQVGGIAMALAGIAWVVASHEEAPDAPRGHTGRGVFFGVLGGLGQAVGLVLSKQGMRGDFSPFQANIIRMLAALLFTWLWVLAGRRAGETVSILRANPGAAGWIALGALVGPVLGVSSSLLAVQHIEVGVASTLMALPPVLVLPLSYTVFKERFGWQAVAGTSLAIAGVAVLFLA